MHILTNKLRLLWVCRPSFRVNSLQHNVQHKFSSLSRHQNSLTSVRRVSSHQILVSGLRARPVHISNGLILRAAFSTSRQTGGKKGSNTTALLYLGAVLVATLATSYAVVPLYKVFCQATGFGGQTQRSDTSEKLETMEPVKYRKIKIRFNADTSASMQWGFRPQQKEITVVPGQTALAFYTAPSTPVPAPATA
eukprot:Colp12_sorted_trinity150504_noHs@30914